MSLNFGKWRFALLAAALAAAPAAVRAVEDVLSVGEIMESLNADYHAVERRLFRNRIEAADADLLEEMARLYGRLRGAYRPFYGGSPESWTAACDRSLAAMGPLRAAWDARDAARVRAGLDALAAIREEAHREFQPGLLRRIFGKKERHERKINENQ